MIPPGSTALLAIVAKISPDLREILATPEVREKLAAAGKIIALGMTLQEFKAFLDGALKKWAPVNEKVNIELD